MGFKRICSRLYSITCLLGFLFQVYQVSALYFRYITSSKVHYQVKDIENYQSLMFCPRSKELLNRSRHQEYGISASVPDTYRETLTELSILTIKDILTLTPAASDVMKHCFKRDDLISAPIRLNQSECYSFFEVIKSVSGETICYTFMPKFKTQYFVGDASTSQIDANVVYEVNLSPAMARTVLGYFIHYSGNAHDYHDKDPLVSRMYRAKITNSNTFYQSKIAMFAEYTYITRLPPPHDTMCAPGYVREKCYETCLESKLSIIHKVPWSSYIEKEVELKMLTLNDLENRTIAPYVYSSFRDCRTMCKVRAECFTSFSKTSIQVSEDRQNGNSFALQALTPGAPYLFVFAVPCVTLIEFVVQVGSCFGVWFGLSIVSINPVRWKLFHYNSSTQVRVFNTPSRTLFRFSNPRRTSPKRNFAHMCDLLFSLSQ